MTFNSDEERRKEDEQQKLIHILTMPDKDSLGICTQACGDTVCSIGCLSQPAKIFRPQIMQGIRLCRERNWYKEDYPLYGMAARKMNCTEKPLQYCVDPVCMVSGCLERPAFHYRHLIQIAIQEEIINKLKR